ncbi:MAG: CHAT domain-containing protein [Propionivibrio sp.]|nr:CHAT domain-containing protein [Propionivibrio sp.]
MKHIPAKPLRLISGEVKTGTDLPLPGILHATTRSGVSEVDPLLAGLVVEKVYTLGAPTRGEPAGKAETLDTAQPELLAVETEDGTTLFIRSDTLAETIARLQPEAVVDGQVDFARFHDPNARARGIGDVLWKLASVLRLPADGLFDEAKDLALDWAKEKLGEQVESKAYEWGSVLGAKALMWRIESHLAGRPGLYLWHDKLLAPGDRCEAGDPRLTDAAQGKPMLVLIHGTGSYTVGGFSDLREDETTWSQLRQRFPGGIFGFEHRTFSESPSENALALLEALPTGAKVSLLTHSRGGLVGDLLCLGQVADRVIDAYSIDTRGADDPAGLEREAQEERVRLRRIRDTLLAGKITVERYVRVASPARGTRFLSENLDAALSDFLNLLQWGGGALVGVAASALGGPVAGQAFGKGASSSLGVVKRLLLEIAGRRIDARLVPGIAAMCIDSPLAAFLAHPDTHRRDGIAMAVIAGDTEFDGFGLSNLRRRVANLFCDWRLFDRNDNDLVVDTDSMYAGLGFRPGASYLYDQDSSVTHFRYFRNPPTRDALRGWLADEEPGRLTQFQPLTEGSKTPWRDREARRALRGGPVSGADPTRPVVILIPGIMGSHIEIDRKKPNQPGSGNRIWFDIPSLSLGELESIGDPDAKQAAVEDLFEMFYGDLADHLAETHTVIRCPYDWRQPLEKCAEELKKRIELAAAENPGQPIRLLAHSMGGLVARTLIKKHNAAWQTVMNSGGRLIMLGTPNNGAHLMVHTLLGKTSSMRMLEKIDIKHDLQSLLDIISGFPGALALLPRPGFADTGNEARIATGAYYSSATWQQLKDANTDRWYDDQICGIPSEPLLADSENFWNTVLPDNEIPNPERVGYVFGQSDKTPCGIQRAADGRLKLLFTADGDGSVTWASGRLDNLDPDTRCWYMPVEHGDLTGEADYFPAIVDLLEKGTTEKLNRLPRQRGETAGNFILEAPPPIIAGEDELARAFQGSGPRRRKTSRAKSTLKVSVRAGDLRFLDQPVLCGHYIGDPISGAEASLDEMLDGALAERERLGVYAAEIGTSAIILRPPSREEGARGSRLGAVIVGLGKFNGQLSARQVTATVRAGVVRFLLQMRDALQVRQDAEVRLYSLLIGWNSTASISVAESVAAITRGVLEANHQFSDALGQSREQGATVSELCFIEMFRNAAISSAHAVLDLPDDLADELKRLGARIAPSPTLVIGEGVMDRLSVDGDLGHWSRLIVTDADASETDDSDDRDGSNNSPAPQSGEPSKPADASPGESRYYPERLKYVFLSQRARAEALVQQRQPGLIEAIIRDQRRNPAYDPKLGQTLFQLMVPLDYKAVAREQSRLLMVLDGYTANLPWELLQSEGEPLVLRMPMVRQLTTLHYRPTVRTANANTACIIVAPSTYGFDKRFGGSHAQLAELPAATREGRAISESLRCAGWSDSNIVVSPADKDALDILATLYDRPYRILMIGAHGIFEARGLDGRSYTGVVLSDGLLLTAVEVAQMEVVPEIVFLSCCHLGSVNNPHSQPNKLAYSLSRKLIEMGVRCVVAAGWAVNDDAACTFASTFFDELTGGETFGEAIFAARKAAFNQHPGSNTWGAYQAYGDPGYRLQANAAYHRTRKTHPFVAVDELLATINGHQVKNKRRKSDAKPPTIAQQMLWVQRQLARCPPEWADRPEVLQAIAALYAEQGDEGFDAAREAYQRAVQLEDKSGRVAVKAIEQLANMEARHGGKLADRGEFDAATALIDSAIRRLNALVESVRGEGAPGSNAERAAMLGSAYKLKAAALLKMNKGWGDVSPCLDSAAKAYASGVQGDPALKPYNTLNALPLAWLADSLAQPRKEAASLARQCGETSRKSFASSKNFWDAVMSVDAEMTAWLLGSALEDLDAEAESASKNSPALILQRRYEQAVRALPGSAREWDSVVKQWRLLAGFIRLSARKESAKYAENLIALADHFAPGATVVDTATPASPKESATVNTRTTSSRNPRKARSRKK